MLAQLAFAFSATTARAAVMEVPGGRFALDGVLDNAAWRMRWDFYR